MPAILPPSSRPRFDLDAIDRLATLLTLIYIAGGMQSHAAAEHCEEPSSNDTKGSTL